MNQRNASWSIILMLPLLVACSRVEFHPDRPSNQPLFLIDEEATAEGWLRIESPRFLIKDFLPQLDLEWRRQQDGAAHRGRRALRASEVMARALAFLDSGAVTCRRDLTPFDRRQPGIGLDPKARDHDLFRANHRSRGIRHGDTHAIICLKPLVILILDQPIDVAGSIDSNRISLIAGTHHGERIVFTAWSPALEEHFDEIEARLPHGFLYGTQFDLSDADVAWYSPDAGVAPRPVTWDPDGVARLQLPEGELLLDQAEGRLRVRPMVRQR